MDIFAIAGLCLTATIICKIMEKYNKEYSLFISILVAGLVIIITISYFTPIIDTVKNLFSRGGVAPENIGILFKALGICYVTQFAYDICKDNGEGAIAAQVELIGKITLIILALPLVEMIIGVVERLSAL